MKGNRVQVEPVLRRSAIASEAVIRHHMLELRTTRTGPRLRMTVEGELDASSSHVLDGYIREEQQSGCTSIIIDLRGLTFIDSSGLGALVSGARRASQDGTGFHLVNAGGAVHATFQAAGVGNVLRYLNRSRAKI